MATELVSRICQFHTLCFTKNVAPVGISLVPPGKICAQVICKEVPPGETTSELHMLDMEWKQASKGADPTRGP